MEERGENSSSVEVYEVQVPTTPPNQFNKASFEETVTKRSFSCWENFGSKSQPHDISAGIYNSLSMDNMEMWHNISCTDLLALADATVITKDGQPNPPTYLFDLNSPQRTVTEPLLSTGSFSQFTPVTPENLNVCAKKATSDLDEQSQTTVSTRVEANQDFEKALSEKTNLDNTPQPKQTRRKHRPKVVVEGQTRSAKKSTPSKPDGSSTRKRKYVRKNKVENSTATPAMEETNVTRDPRKVQQTKKSCRRKINFDEEQNLHAKVESMVEKTQVKITFNESCSTNQVENQAMGPITPSKTELQHERLIKDAKHTYKAVKCHINFSQETHDKGPSLVLSPKESNHSISACFSIGKKASQSKQECSTMIDGIGVQSELSIYSEYQENNCRFLVDKNAIKAPELSTVYRVKNDQQYFRCMPGFDHLGNFKKKRTKCVKRVCDPASFEPIFHMGMAPNKLIKRRSGVPSSLHHNHYCLTDDTGHHPRLTWKNINGIEALTYQFEQLDINSCIVEKDKNALVPYQRGGSLVPFEGLFNPVKRRKTRPKVDLDDETSRVWRLLLEDINSRGIDGTDEEKEKWWEEERKVFSGRADSFIARMHLVQGDRRFSRWKGSVVDSVIGVFLTQNVSDHLSSSAFMSLAARYPLKSESISEELQEEKSSISFREPSQVDLEETIKWYEEKSENQPVKDHGSIFSNIELKDNSKIEVLEVYENIVSSINSSETSQTSRKELEDMSKTTILDISSFSEEISGVGESNNVVESYLKDSGNNQTIVDKTGDGSSIGKRGIIGKGKEIKVDWDSLRIEAQVKEKRERTPNTMDSLDYDAVRCADVNDVADSIKERGMNNRLAERIQDFLNRVVRDHGSIDLEWLRDVPPDKAKEYLLSFRGLGLKSVECVRLLTLHHLAFPVDTNVGRIAVRLGWVPLQPLPESLQLHLLELYPVLESIQKYLWPRLCKLDQRTLYELHYQMITFGKVFCTKSKPNCNACPLRGECRHFASAFASARLALPPTEEKSMEITTETRVGEILPNGITNQQPLITLPPENEQMQVSEVQNCDPVIEEPTTPERQQEQEVDIEDFCEDSEEIPMIKLNIQEFTHNLQNYMERNMELGECDVSRALVALTPEAASIPVPKLKNVSQLRTEHHVYELPDSHPLLDGLDKREPDDPCSYLLAIWTPGETADSIQPTGQCCSQESGTLCNEETCFFCNSTREANSQTVRGTLLLPCRTAMRGSFPLNGTYFQVNEVFADHESSLNPIDVPRSWLWNLPRRTVYFGTSIPTIFKGLTTQSIQYCFWRGFVCVRGFDRVTRAPRPLMARLHFPASKLKRAKAKTDEKTSTPSV